MFYFSGYQAYIGMMMVDIYHNHPLLKAAVEILRERVENTSFRASQANSPSTGTIYHILSSVELILTGTEHVHDALTLA